MTSNSSTICLRLKRQNQTYFIKTSKTNTIQSIKEEISKATNYTIPANKMKIYMPSHDDDDDGHDHDDNDNNVTIDNDEENEYDEQKRSVAAATATTTTTAVAAGHTMTLPDAALLSDHDKIQNDTILYIVFRKKGMEDAAASDEFGELDTVWEDVHIVRRSD